MELEKYLEQQERASWETETMLLQRFNDDLNECIEDRRKWEEQARWGRQVQKYDFSFMGQYLGNKKTTIPVWGVNFVATNIGYSIAAAIAADVKISLESEDKEYSKPITLTEAKLNYAIDKFKVLRKSDQGLWDVEFTGMAYGRLEWNPKDQDGTWFNGKPTYRIIMPEDTWLDPATKAKDKSDKRYLIYREQYATTKLRKISPELNKLIDNYYTNLEAVAADGKTIPRIGIISAYHYLYKKTISMKRRAIVNEENPKVKWVYEKEWENTIKSITKQPEMSPEVLEQFKEMGELQDETKILPEGLRTTKPMASEVDYWFEALLIPELKIVITAPKIQGKRCPVAIMAGNHNPHSAYSFGNAWKSKALLELSILNMTIQFFDTVKKNKPIISILPGSIINEKEVREKWGEPNLIIYWNLKFLKDNYPKITKADCLSVIKVPESGQMQILLDEKLQQAASEAQVTPAVSKGQQPYAGMPAEGIARLQQAAAIGSKNSYIEYQEFIIHIVEVMKDLFIKHVNYEHKMLSVNESGDKVNEEVNTESDNMLANAEDSIVSVVLEENSQISKTIKEQKLMWAYGTLDETGKPLITSNDLMRGVLPEDSERLIAAKKKFMEENPMLMQQALPGMTTGIPNATLGGGAPSPVA